MRAALTAPWGYCSSRRRAPNRAAALPDAGLPLTWSMQRFDPQRRPSRATGPRAGPCRPGPSAAVPGWPAGRAQPADLEPSSGANRRARRARVRVCAGSAAQPRSLLCWVSPSVRARQPAWRRHGAKAVKSLGRKCGPSGRPETGRSALRSRQGSLLEGRAETREKEGGRREGGRWGRRKHGRTDDARRGVGAAMAKRASGERPATGRRGTVADERGPGGQAELGAAAGDNGEKCLCRQVRGLHTPGQGPFLADWGPKGAGRM